jgi:hypothetical protein
MVTEPYNIILKRSAERKGQDTKKNSLPPAEPVNDQDTAQGCS